MKNGFNLWRRELKRNTLLHLIEIKYLFPFKMISFFSFDRESSNLRLFSPLLNSISGGSSTARSLKSSTFLLSQFQISALNQCRLPHFIPSIFLRQLFQCRAISSRNNSDFSASPDAPIDAMQCILISSPKTLQF